MKPVEGILNYLTLTDGLGTAGQPTMEQLSAIKEAGYETVINLALPNSTGALPNERNLVEGLGMEYVPIPVVWEQPDVEDARFFFEAMEARQDRKVFVHCAMNMRVSAFMFLYRSLREGWPPADAEKDLRRIWVPNERWHEFIREVWQHENPEGWTTYQLRVLMETTRLLTEAGLPHWLFGGWGVDFRVGEQTRLHGDIDFVLNQEDAALLRETLKRSDYAECHEIEDPEWSARFYKWGHIVEITFAKLRKDGGFYFMDGRWPDRAFVNDHVCFRDISSPVLSAESLLEMKEGYLKDEENREDRQKYEQDRASLRSFMAVAR